MVIDGEEFSGTERFLVERRIGAGGMGVVYQAYDCVDQYCVAIKTIRKMEPASLLRFKKEFREMAKLEHPNLVQLLQLYGDEDQKWFFTMELVENGADLLTYLLGAGKNDEASTGSSPANTDGTGVGLTDWGPFTAAAPSSDGDSSPNLTFHQPLSQYPSSSFSPLYQRSRGNLLARPMHLHRLDYEILRRTFLQLVEGVREMHIHGKLHRDLKPGNVLVQASGHVMLLDFGLIWELTHPAEVRDHVPSPGIARSRSISWEESTMGRVAGTLAYMSPEQAIGLDLTAASDWYSVGVMLYQVLTGRLPYSGNHWELIDNRPPPPPLELVSSTPADLNELCMGLLQRTPEARPDYTQIRTPLGEGQSTTLPRTDSSYVASAVEQNAAPFVGRQAHLAELNRSLNRVMTGQTVLQQVHGRSGAGKSVLLEHFVSAATEQGAIVLMGRCYEQETVPYKAVDQLIDSLTRYLLRLDSAEVASLIPRDMAALTRVFPVLRRVKSIAAAAADDVDAPDLAEFRQQAFASLRQLLSRLGARAPLILCVDDLQWGDPDSASLLTAIVQPPDPPRVLLLIAYRSEYVDSNPCLKTLTSLSSDCLLVDALTPVETRQMMASILGQDTPEQAAKAEWVVREAGGSAFFIFELVRHLRSRGSGASVEGLTLDEMLWHRIQRLPQEERELLEVVSVAGAPLRVHTAREVLNRRTGVLQTVKRLRLKQLVRTTGPNVDDEVEAYHDRVRETTVARLPKDSLCNWHQQLATTLEAARHPDAEMLATHFAGAGQNQKASRYFVLAAKQAMKVLAFKRAESHYRRAADLADGELEKAAVYEQLVHFYTDMARFGDAYAVGRTATARLGVNLPVKFVPPLFALDYVRSRMLLRRRRAQSLIQLPTMNNARLEAAVRLINAVAKAAYQVRPELCVAVATKSVNLCLRHGNTRDCAVGYMVYGSIFHGGVLKKHQVGHDFGRLAIDLVDKYANPVQRAEVNFVVGYFGTSWLKPAHEAEALWAEAYRTGLAEGDLFHTGCAAAGITMSQHMRAVPMDQLLETCDSFLQVLRRYRLTEHIAVLTGVQQFIRNMRGFTTEPHAFDDETFNEAAHARQLTSFGARHFAHFFFILKMQSLYLRGCFPEALQYAEMSARYLKDSPGMLHSAEHHLYQALILSALYPSLTGMRGWTAFRAIRAAHGKFKDWARKCPPNFDHKERLLSAEMARAAGKIALAIKHYQQAIAAAGQHQYLSIKAIAHHRLAMLLKQKDHSPAAMAQLDEAKAAYRAWGATSFADQLAI